MSSISKFRYYYFKRTTHRKSSVCRSTSAFIFGKYIFGSILTFLMRYATIESWLQRWNVNVTRRLSAPVAPIVNNVLVGIK